MEECGSVNSPHGRNASIVNNEKSYTLNGPDGSTINIGHGLSKVSLCLFNKVHCASVLKFSETCWAVVHDCFLPSLIFTHPSLYWHYRCVVIIVIIVIIAVLRRHHASSRARKLRHSHYLSHCQKTGIVLTSANVDHHLTQHCGVYTLITCVCRKSCKLWTPFVIF